MNKKIVTWIGVISGLVTLIVVSASLFENEARLEAYIEVQEIVTKVEKSFYINDEMEQELSTISVVKLTLKNNGELPAKNIHIELKDFYKKVIIKSGGNYQEVKEGDPVYISNLEPDGEVKLFYIDTLFTDRAYWLSEKFSIASGDSGKAILRTDIKGEGVIWYIKDFFIYISIFCVFVLYFLIFLISHLHGKNKITIPKDKVDLEAKLAKISHAWSMGVLDEEEFKVTGKKLLDKDLEDNN
jgi:hypothetical protein